MSLEGAFGFIDPEKVPYSVLRRLDSVVHTLSNGSGELGLPGGID